MTGNLIAEADASVSGTEEPGFLIIEALLTDSREDAIATARRLISEQLQRISNEPPTAEELERAINKFESRFILSTSSYMKKAEKLAMAEMQGENINDIIPRYRKLTPEAIRAAAATIFNPKRVCTLIYKPVE